MHDGSIYTQFLVCNVFALSTSDYSVHVILMFIVSRDRMAECFSSQLWKSMLLATMKRQLASGGNWEDSG